MDGKGNRGAYAQVTAPIGDESKVTVEQGGKSGGMSSSCTPKRLGIAVVLAIAAIIIIIVIVVISTKNSKSDPVVQGTPTVASNVTQAMVTSVPSKSSIPMNDTVPSVPSQSNMPMTIGVMKTTQPPTMKTTTTTTFGPAAIGSFKGTFVMNKAYGTFFDDVRAPMTIAFKNNFTAAMDEVYNVPSAALYMYQETMVDQLVQNGTNVQVKFTVSLDAINRGGRDHLVTMLGSFPSDTINTYAVLYADIEPEKEPSLGA